VDRQKLKTGFLERYSNHTVDIITAYASEKKCSITTMAEKLRLEERALREWHSKISVPAWSAYFDLKLRIGGVISKQRTEEHVAGMHAFFTESIDLYVEQQHLQKQEFARLLGIADRTIREWRAGFLPNPPSTLHTLETIYAAPEAGTACMDLILEAFPLAERQYGKVLASLRTTPSDITAILAQLPTEKSFESHSSLPTQDTPESAEMLDELMDFLRSYRPSSPKEAIVVVKAMYQCIGVLTDYLGEEKKAVRDELRRLCSKHIPEYSISLVHARQLLREEHNYQEYRRMNSMKPT
jgi:DNA-binding transcriptional regulator YiaG